MALQPSSDSRNVTGIMEEERRRICDFLQGAVYTWCNARPDDCFSARDFLGRLNADWSNTPMIVLYNKHIDQGKDESQAVDAAGKDAGWLLKSVLREDKRTFDHFKDEGEGIRKYRWLR